MSDNTIDQSNSRLQTPATGQSKGAAAPGATAPGGNAANPASTVAGNDTVQLTPTAQRLAELETSLNKIPDVREDRVNQLRQAIADGSYTPSSERIADRLITQELALTRNRR